MGLIYEVAIIMTKNISKCLEIRQHASKNPQVSPPHPPPHTHRFKRNKKFRKCKELSDNKNTTYQDLWDTKKCFKG